MQHFDRNPDPRKEREQSLKRSFNASLITALSIHTMADDLAQMPAKPAVILAGSIISVLGIENPGRGKTPI
jgi:hypothetical protein